MRKLLTDLAIQKLKWNGATTTYWDENLPAFGVRVGKLRKTFIIVQGKKRTITTIGHYPDKSLQEAKKRAKFDLSHESLSLANTTFLEAIPRFLEDVKGRLKPDTVSQYKYYLETLGFKNGISELTSEDVRAKLQLFAGRPWGQNYAYAALRCFLNWCLDQEYIDKHPLIRGKLPNKTRSRDRVLSDDELARIWRCTEDNTYGRILRILLLTGQRRMEVRNLKPEDVADGLITFHTKGDKINVLPITPLVQENLVLPFKFNNWALAKQRFDTDCGVDWVHHDLRRTLATKLAQLGVDFVVIERVLGHTQNKLIATYHRYDYLTEVKKALLLYEDHIRSKLSSP